MSIAPEQLKTKWLKDGSVDGNKIKIKKNQSIKGTAQDGSEVELLKLNSSDKVEVLGSEIVSAVELAAETSQRQINDGVIDNKINEEIISRMAETADLYQKVSDEEAARILADSNLETFANELSSDLAQEILDREAADLAAIAEAKGYADQKVAALVDSAPAVLDTLKELSSALGNDANFATTVSNNIGTVSSNLASEISRAQAAEQALSSSISSEVTARQSADTTLQSNINTVSASVTSVESSVSSILAKLDTSVYYHELHVNFDYTGSTVDGSEYAPFKTIQSAVDLATGAGRIGANTVIYVHPKKNTSVTENVTISSAAANLFIKALASGVDAAQIVINGQFKIMGTSVRVRLEGFQISSPSGTPCLVVEGSNGAHSFINMDFAGGGGVQFTGSWKSWHQFVDCGITGPLSLGGTPSANSIVTLYRLRGACTPAVTHANATLSIIEAYSLAGLTHSAGNVSLMRVSGPSANYNSTAAFPAIFGMVDCSMQKIDLSFAKINKTGTGLFFLSNVNRDEANDVLSGTRTNFGATIADAKFVPAVSGSWSSSVISAKTALDEVMAKAKTSETGLASEITRAQAAEAQALVDAKAYTDSSISGKASVSYVDTQDAAKLVEAKSYADGIVATEQAAREAADTLLQAAIAAKTVYFGKSNKELSGADAYVDLDHEAVADSLVVYCDCYPLHKDTHYTASVVSGKTRLTFINHVAPGGIQEFEAGEYIHATYLKA